MTAATKSRIECKASDKMPRLPVRSTRNTFSDTNKTAEPTEARAANRFSRVERSRGSKAIGGLYAWAPTRKAGLMGARDAPFWKAGWRGERGQRRFVCIK